MRISELSRRSGVSIPTIKYYIREGLLPGGELTSANQARYEPAHLERLALIRALREVAGLGVAAVKETLRALDAPAPSEGLADTPPPLVLAMRALEGPPTLDDGTPEEATERVDALLEELGWEVPEAAAARVHLARALAAIDRHWRGGVSLDMLTAYGRLAGELARLEIPDAWDPDRDPAEALRYAVLGTVLFEPVILSLRRLAHAERGQRLAARWRAGPGA